MTRINSSIQSSLSIRRSKSRSMHRLVGHRRIARSKPYRNPDTTRCDPNFTHKLNMRTEKHFRSKPKTISDITRLLTLDKNICDTVITEDKSNWDISRFSTSLTELTIKYEHHNFPNALGSVIQAFHDMEKSDLKWTGSSFLALDSALVKAEIRYKRWIDINIKLQEYQVKLLTKKIDPNSFPAEFKESIINPESTDESSAPSPVQINFKNIYQETLTSFIRQDQLNCSTDELIKIFKRIHSDPSRWSSSCFSLSVTKILISFSELVDGECNINHVNRVMEVVQTQPIRIGALQGHRILISIVVGVLSKILKSELSGLDEIQLNTAFDDMQLDKGATESKLQPSKISEKHLLIAKRYTSTVNLIIDTSILLSYSPKRKESLKTIINEIHSFIKTPDASSRTYSDYKEVQHNLDMINNKIDKIRPFRRLADKK